MENLTAKDINDRLTNKIAWVSVIVGLEIVLGFIGNVVVIYVFGRRYHHCNFRYFVLCIALIDLLSVFTTMPADIVSQLYWYVYPMGKAFCKIKTFLNIFTVYSETYCLCAVAVDRWRKMCRPHGWQIRPKHAFRICIVIALVAAVQSSPVLVLWGLYSYQIENITVTVCEKDEKYIGSNSHQIYSCVNTVILISIIVAMNGLYAALYITISRTLFKNTHHLQTNASRADEPTTKPEVDTHSVDITGDIIGSIRKSSRTNIMNLNLKEPTAECTERSTCSPCVLSKNANDVYIVTSPATAKGIGSIRKSSSTDSINLDYKEPIAKGPESSTSSPCVLSKNAETVTIPDSANGRDIKNLKNIRLRNVTKQALTLCLIFSTTIAIFIGLQISIGTNKKNKMHDLSDNNKALYIFALKLVFINHVINPFVYWIMDKEFRSILSQAFLSNT